MTSNLIQSRIIKNTRATRCMCALLLACVAMLWSAWDNCSAQSFRVLHEFTRVGPASYGARSALAVAEDGFLYGTTFETGGNSLGKIYRINTHGEYSVVKRFLNELEGSFPRWILADGDVLYGVAAQGGNSIHGTVFKLSTSGEGYTVLKKFNGDDGSGPFCLVRDGSVLYGTTVSGGLAGQGTLFRLQTDGDGFQVLQEFFGTNGAIPWSLTVSDHLLYGTTGSGGDFDGGTVFRLETNGASFRILKSMNSEIDGMGTRGPLIVKDGVLFGVNDDGGPGGGGVVFRMDTNGSDFRILKTFQRVTGDYRPEAGLVRSGNTLYGVTSRGVLLQTKTPVWGLSLRT